MAPVLVEEPALEWGVVQERVPVVSDRVYGLT